MVSVNDEQGQALVIVVVLIAVAAASVVGLRAAQERLVASVREHRAGEAAVEAAAASFADAYVSWSEPGLGASADIRTLLGDREAAQRARAAGDELARANRGFPIETLSASCERGRIDVSLSMKAFTHRAGFAAPECSRH